jgi:hypothetical protein
VIILTNPSTNKLQECQIKRRIQNGNTTNVGLHSGLHVRSNRIGYVCDLQNRNEKRKNEMNKQEAIKVLNKFRNTYYNAILGTEHHEIANALDLVIPDYIALQKVSNNECDDFFKEVNENLNKVLESERIFVANTYRNEPIEAVRSAIERSEKREKTRHNTGV